MGAKGDGPSKIPQATQYTDPDSPNYRGGRMRGVVTGLKKGIDAKSKKNTDHFKIINKIRADQGLPPVKPQPKEPVDDGMINIPYQGEGTVEGYGSGLNAPPGTMFTMQVIDRDGDGKDDRFQKGPSTKFNAKQYLENYADLKQAFGDKEDYKKAAREHYLTYGIKEGRVDTAGGFNAGQYLANYPDLQKAFGDDRAAALKHYKEYGIKEGRTDKNIPTKIDTPRGALPGKIGTERPHVESNPNTGQPSLGDVTGLNQQQIQEVLAMESRMRLTGSGQVIDKSPEARQAFLDSLSKEELEQRAHRDVRGNPPGFHRDVRKILPRDPQTGNPIPPRRHQGIQKQVEEANTPKTSKEPEVVSPTGNPQTDKPLVSRSRPSSPSAQEIRTRNELLAKAEVMKEKRAMEQESIRREQESIGEEERMRDNDAGEIDVSRNIDIGKEISIRQEQMPAREINTRRDIKIGRPLDARPEVSTGREPERRDFTRERSALEGGRRGRSREEREAFRDRYVSTLR